MLAAVAVRGSLRNPSSRSVASSHIVAGLKRKHKPKPKKQPAAQQEEAAAAIATPVAPPARIDTSQFRIRTWKRLLKQVRSWSVRWRDLVCAFSSGVPSLLINLREYVRCRADPRVAIAAAGGIGPAGGAEGGAIVPQAEG